MHPEIGQDRRAACAKCGMALEPVLPALNDNDKPEQVDFRRRFWWTPPLTTAVFVLAMFSHRRGWFAMATSSWIEFMLSLPPCLPACLPACSAMRRLARLRAWRPIESHA